MWILEPNYTKAALYATKIFEYNGLKFFDARKNFVKKNVPRSLQDTEAYRYITESRFKKYLDAKPGELLDLHQALFGHLYDRLVSTSPHVFTGRDTVFNQVHFTEYRKDVLKNVAVRRHPEYSVINDVEINAIKHIFNYDNYISRNTSFSYYLAELMDSNTCTYCNRQYTLTIKDCNGERVIRPEFDHWFAQSLYPDLALSYFNLIPSCSFCNSILKNDTETELATHIHPYIDRNPGFSFGYSLVPSGGYAVEVNITETDSRIRKRIENTLRLFKIKEVYGAHSDLELRDLIELATANPDDYIDSLVRRVLRETELTREDVFRLLFGIEIDSAKYINRPLSKFKSDIIKKIHSNYQLTGHIK